MCWSTSYRMADTIARAKYSAMRERSLGLGAMGFHSLIHKHGVAWESELAKEINEQVFSFIHNEAHAETELLAEERGAYLDEQRVVKETLTYLRIETKCI